MSKPKRSKAHVVPEPGAGKRWVVYWYAADDGPTDPPGVDIFDTKKLAVSAAVTWAKDWTPSQIFIHTRDGKIADERSYGTDPPETQGVVRAKVRR